jgi:hypothetical protein
VGLYGKIKPYLCCGGGAGGMKFVVFGRKMLYNHFEKHLVYAY